MSNPKRIMLLLTEACNLACVYCYEQRKTTSKMSFETAKSILSSELAEIAPGKTIVLELFGGEAFANFPLMKQIDEYLVTNYQQLDIKYETTTNGTLVHGNIQQWLYERKDRFFIALSLDGTPAMHDQNRVFIGGGGTYDSIDIDFFSTTWPGCPAKMTVSRKTLSDLAQGVEHIENLGFKCDATLSTGIDWDYEENTHILVRELDKLVKHYMTHSNSSLCTMLNLDLRQIFTPIDENYRFCGAGLDMLCFDTCGHAYPCQGFAPISIGDEAGAYRNFDETKFMFTNANICKRCPWVRLCPNCYAANLQSTKNIQQVDPHLCAFYKLCILASAKIQCLRILNKAERTHDDQLILKAVSRIQAELGHE